MEKIVDLLRDQIWTTVFSILTIIITIYFFVKQFRKKEISCNIEELLLLKKNKELLGKVDIVTMESDVDNVYLVLVKLINSGQISIQSSDFNKNISINFENSEMIIDAFIHEQFPDDLDAKITKRENRIEVDPILLNKGDLISIKILVANHFNSPNISCRINGISKLRFYDNNKNYSLTKFSMFFIVPVTIVTILLLFILSTISIWLVFATLLIVSVAMIISFRNDGVTISRETTFKIK